MIKRVQLLASLLVVIIPCSIALSSGRAAVDSAPSPWKSTPEASPPAAQERPAPTEKMAEQVYKNIQIFKGVPASQLDADMAFISGSLGVRCSYCHAGSFEKDDKATKQTARQMIRMVFDLNRGSFNGQGAVSCYTCHRGQPQPVSVPTVGQNLWQSSNQTSKPDAPLPGVDEILERYVQAVGGRQAIERVTSRVWKGSRVGADGVLVPEEVYAKAPNKLLTITSYPNQVFRTGFNGSGGWAVSSQGARELNEELLAQLRREAEFHKETRLKEIYTKMVVLGRAAVGEREAFVVEATPADGGSPEKLFFDVQTGLLVRKYSTAKTVLGRFPTQTDYDDYRDVDGIKLPFVIRWAIPGRTWGRKITEVRQNVPLDDAQFDSPANVK
jgi:Photosynthetic reaction centre cytochrome C subunit